MRRALHTRLAPRRTATVRLVTRRLPGYTVIDSRLSLQPASCVGDQRPHSSERCPVRVLDGFSGSTPCRVRRDIGEPGNRRLQLAVALDASLGRRAGCDRCVRRAWHGHGWHCFPVLVCSVDGNPGCAARSRRSTAVGLRRRSVIPHLSSDGRGLLYCSASLSKCNGVPSLAVRGGGSQPDHTPDVNPPALGRQQQARGRWITAAGVGRRFAMVGRVPRGLDRHCSRIRGASGKLDQHRRSSD